MKKFQLFGLTGALALTAASVATVVLARPEFTRAARRKDDAFKVEKLAFMTGSWLTTLRNGEMEEHWMPPAAGSMLGMMRQVTGGKTGIREFEVIEETPEGVLMTIKHFSPKMEELPGRVLSRKLVSLKEGEAVFESTGPEPKQKLIYRKADDGGLRAVIEIDRGGGKVQTLDFAMKRMAVK